MTAIQEAPRRRSRRRLIIVVVIVVALLALIFAADRGLQALAERRVAAEVQTTLGAEQAPTVDLGPPPFLVEAATGRIRSAQVQLPEVELPNSNGADAPKVVATDVDATFSDVTVSDGFTRMVAADGRATGLLPYPSLSALIGLEVAYAAPERVRVAFSAPIGRLSVNGTATGRPVLDVGAQALTIEDAEVTIPGAEGDTGLAEAAGSLVLRRPFPLGELPYDLQVTELTVTEEGVRFAANGKNLPLRG